jgi:hypothetical protein
MPERDDLAATADLDDAEHAVAVWLDRGRVLVGAAEADSARAATVREARRADTALLPGDPLYPSVEGFDAAETRIHTGESAVET